MFYLCACESNVLVIQITSRHLVNPPYRRHGIPNNWPRDCLGKRLLGQKAKSLLAFCPSNLLPKHHGKSLHYLFFPPITKEFPLQRASRKRFNVMTSPYILYDCCACRHVFLFTKQSQIKSIVQKMLTSVNTPYIWTMTYYDVICDHHRHIMIFIHIESYCVKLMSQLQLQNKYCSKGVHSVCFLFIGGFPFWQRYCSMITNVWDITVVFVMARIS